MDNYYRRCPQCNMLNQANSKFCVRCGINIENTNIIVQNKKSKGNGCVEIFIFFIVMGFLWSIISPAIDRYKEEKDNTQEDVYHENVDVSSVASSEAQSETTEKKDLKFISEVLFQNDNITITLISGDSKQLSFEIENIGKEDITYKLTGLCVNGIMQNGYIDAYQSELPCQKKSKLDVSIRNVLKKYDDINSVEIAFSYYSENDYVGVDTGILCLDGNYEKQQFNAQFPEDAINNNNVYVYKTYLGNDKIIYNIVNKNDYTIITNIENCSLNDWVFSPEYSSIENEDAFGIRLDGYDICVFPESVACVTVNFTEFMSENNINEVKNFEFTLDINEISNYSNNWEIANIKFQK